MERRGEFDFSDSTKIKNELTINIYVGDLDPNHARTPIINRINPIIIKMILRNTTMLEDSKNLAEPMLLEYSITENNEDKSCDNHSLGPAVFLRFTI